MPRKFIVTDALDAMGLIGVAKIGDVIQLKLRRRVRMTFGELKDIIERATIEGFGNDWEIRIELRRPGK